MKRKLAMGSMVMALMLPLLGMDGIEKRWRLTAEFGYNSVANKSPSGGLFLCTGLQIGLGKKRIWALKANVAHFDGPIFPTRAYWYLSYLVIEDGAVSSSWVIDVGVLRRFRLNEKINAWVEAGTRQQLEQNSHFRTSIGGEFPDGMQIFEYEGFGKSDNFLILGFIGSGVEWKLHPAWGFRAGLLGFFDPIEHTPRTYAEVKAGVYFSF